MAALSFLHTTELLINHPLKFQVAVDFFLEVKRRLSKCINLHETKRRVQDFDVLKCSEVVWYDMTYIMKRLQSTDPGSSRQTVMNSLENILHLQYYLIPFGTIPITYIQNTIRWIFWLLFTLFSKNVFMSRSKSFFFSKSSILVPVKQPM